MTSHSTRPTGMYDLPVNELRMGYRSAKYFNRMRTILNAEKPDHVSTMQVFQKREALLCGVDEAIAILRLCAGRWSDEARAEKVFDALRTAKSLANGSFAGAPNLHARLHMAADLEAELDSLWVSHFDDLEVKALEDGDEISPWEPVMTITGPLAVYAHLESVYLGVLARRTKVATNTRAVVRAANGKPLLFFADRFDQYQTQEGDGYAAYVGGASGMATDAMGAWNSLKGMGTMPHALIASFDGDVVEASRAFQKHFPDEALIALVDFTNDCVDDAVACADTFGDDLWGVRLDTSENMIDRSVAEGRMGDFKPTGVNPQLVRNVREALDMANRQRVKIIVSGGFNPEKIRQFEADDVPVDSYAVGSSLLQGGGDYTADIVAPVAKKGRWLRDASRLGSVDA